MTKEEIEQLITVAPDDQTRLRWLNEVAYSLRTTNPRQMLELALKAREIAEKINDSEGLADALRNAGLAYNQLGNTELALQRFQHAYSLYVKIGDKAGLTFSTFQIGHLYRRKGQQQQGLEWLFKSLALAEEHNLPEVMSSSLTSIGSHYAGLELYSEALNCFNRALRINEALNDPLSIASACLSIGGLYAKMEQLAKANDYLHRALEYLRGLDAWSLTADTLARLALVQQKQKEYAEALENYQTALEIYRELGVKRGLGQTLISLAELQYEIGDYEKALENARLALAHAIEVSYRNLEYYSHELLSKIHQALENYAKALEHYKAYADIRMEMMQQVNQEILAAREAQANYEKAQHQNEIYKLKNIELVNLNNELHLQKVIVEEKNIKITESITYARKIQGALLPKVETISRKFPNSFLIYRPKDIVSGDFYWFTELKQGGAVKGECSLLAVVDCTGHGVPGAFMSLIGHSLLNNIVVQKQVLEPGEILHQLDVEIRRLLGQDGSAEKGNDGMDICMCLFRKNVDAPLKRNRTGKPTPKQLPNQTELQSDIPGKAPVWADHIIDELLFAGANRPLYIIRKGQPLEFRGDRHPVGGNQHGEKHFQTQTIPIYPGDRIYLTTDGVFDQFGGESKRKFTYRRFLSAIMETIELPMPEQGKKLTKVLLEWQGYYDQLDDITILGIEWQ